MKPIFIFISTCLIYTTACATDTQTGSLTNVPNVKGEQTIIGISAAIGLIGKAGTGEIGGAAVTSDSITLKNTKTGDVLNAPTSVGATKITASGKIVNRSVAIDGGNFKNVVNAPKRRSDISVTAGGVEGTVGFSGVKAATTGSVVVDSVCSSGNVRASGDVTNAGTADGKATYGGSNVTVNSIRLGDC